MNCCKILIAISALMFAQLTCAANDKQPPAGSYGFDWLRPTTARCSALPARNMEKLEACNYAKGQAFGLDIPSWRCRVNARSEYFFFASKAQCIEALETMQANAP